MRTLECKGTTSGSYAITQLAKATRQLDGITVGGRVPQGLAVSTITGKGKVKYLAIDPAEEEQEPSYEVSGRTLDQASNFSLSDTARDVPPTLLVSSSLRASWAALADFSGNIAALDRWALPLMRRRLERRERPRVSLNTPYGSAVGTRSTFSIDGRQLDVFYLVDAQIDQHLTQGSFLDINEAQAEFAARTTDVLPYGAAGTFDSAVFSATSDGSVFGLVLD